MGMEHITLLEHIKPLRKKCHLSQKQLASRAGVSQSLIAKVEAGRLDPSYSKAQRILQALEEEQHSKEPKAKQLMKEKVITAAEHQRVEEAVRQMRSRGISQLPVLRQGKIVGMLTEGSILARTADEPAKVKSLRVGEIMEDVPPIVAPETGLRTLLELLRAYPAVLVAEKGELKGIISKADVLGKA